MPTTAERLTALESDRKWHWIALSIGASLFVGWNIFISLTLFGIQRDIAQVAKDLATIKQERKDAGHEIVGRLESPKSSEELQAALATVVAQVKTARAEKVPPKEETLIPLGQAVSVAASKQPEAPEIWPAISTLVSYRYSNLKPSLGNCNDRPFTPTDGGDPVQIPGVRNIGLIIFHDCDFDLSDMEGFQKGGAGRMYARHPGSVVLAFRNVNVTYRGGSVVPAAAYEFQNCSFNALPVASPSKPALEIARQLLAAPDSRMVKVKAEG